MNSTEILNAFLETEYEYGMFEKECSGVKIWQYVRTMVYLYVVQRALGFSSTQTTTNRPVESRSVLKTGNGWYEYNIRRNIFFAGKRDILISSSPFRVEDGDRYYRDIHTSEIDRGLKRTHYILDRRISPTTIVLNRSKNMLTYDTETFDRVFCIQKDRKANKYELEEKFLKPIEAEFGIAFSYIEKKELLNCANRRVFYDNSLSRYCRFLIRRIKPRAIIIVCLPDLINQIICEVAKEEGVPTIEFQHGTVFECISYYYKCPEIKPQGFPDYFFSYGDYERDISRMPIPKDHIIPVGSPELEKMMGSFKRDNQGKKTNILFISSMFDETAKIAKELSERDSSDSFEIVYKLHPKEVAKWESLEPMFRGSRIKVIRDMVSVHKYLVDADWVVGTASNALFEASAYDRIKIAYINNYSTDKYPLIEKGKAVPVYNTNDLLNEIIKDTFIPNKNYDFYKKGSIENINMEIERIINR